MVVALPYLWGVPPAHEGLRCVCLVCTMWLGFASMMQAETALCRREAIEQGGGIVHSVQRQWLMC